MSKKFLFILKLNNVLFQQNIYTKFSYFYGHIHFAWLSEMITEISVLEGNGRELQSQ